MFRRDNMREEQVKKEVAPLTRNLTKKKAKAKLTQAHQYNTTKGVKKIDEGETIACSLCHKEGHKSCMYKVNSGGEKQKQTSKLSNTYTNKVNKKTITPYLFKKENNKVIVVKVKKQANTRREKHIWVPKKIISIMKSTKKVSIPREVKHPMDIVLFEDLTMLR